MAENTVSRTNSTKNVKKQTKIEKIQRLYGEETTRVTLDQTTKHLESIGYTSLGKILQPVRS